MWLWAWQRSSTHKSDVYSHFPAPDDSLSSPIAPPPQTHLVLMLGSCMKANTRRGLAALMNALAAAAYITAQHSTAWVNSSLNHLWDPSEWCQVLQQHHTYSVCMDLHTTINEMLVVLCLPVPPPPNTHTTPPHPNPCPVRSHTLPRPTHLNDSIEASGDRKMATSAAASAAVDASTPCAGSSVVPGRRDSRAAGGGWRV
jgi:hypothetical protein